MRSVKRITYKKRQKEHSGKFIARKGAKVVASAKTLGDLYTELDARKISHASGSGIVIGFTYPQGQFVFIRFPYRFKLSPFGRLCNPVITVQVLTLDGWEDFDFAVDSGSDVSIAPKIYGRKNRGKN